MQRWNRGNASRDATLSKRSRSQGDHSPFRRSLSVHTQFLYIYEREDDQIEHVRCVWINVQMRLPFGTDDAERPPVVSCDLRFGPVVPGQLRDRKMSAPDHRLDSPYSQPRL